MVRTAMVSVALGTSLVLSGCGESKVAATVDGQVITVDDVNSAVTQVNEQIKPQKPITPQAVLTMLIRAPKVLDYAQAHGFAATESAARAAYPVIDPSPATLRVLRVNDAAQNFTEADGLAVSKDLQSLKVTVNPKYGTYDKETAAIGPLTPDWLEFPATAGQ